MDARYDLPRLGRWFRAIPGRTMSYCAPFGGGLSYRSRILLRTSRSSVASYTPEYSLRSLRALRLCSSFDFGFFFPNIRTNGDTLLGVFEISFHNYVVDTTVHELVSVLVFFRLWEWHRSVGFSVR